MGKSPRLTTGARKTAKGSEKRASKGSANDAVPRKLETYRLLVASARRLFAERGYHVTTTHEIASQAGMVDGTFYAHFEDKLACFIAVYEDVSNELYQVIDYYLPPLDSSPEKMLNAWIKATFSYSTANPGIMKIIVSDISLLDRTRKMRLKQSPLDKLLIPIIERWKETGKAAPNFNSKLFTHLIGGATRQGSALIARNPRSRKEIIEQMTFFLVNAIQAKDFKSSAKR